MILVGVLVVGVLVVLATRTQRAAAAPPQLSFINGIPLPESRQALRTSANGLQAIRNFEGLRLTAYQDAAGFAIGYGHTGPDVTAGMTITRDQAEAFLAADVAGAEAAVRDQVVVPLSQSQFDALVSFTYNVGQGNLSRSSLLAFLNAGDYAGAANEFARWIYDATGTVRADLVGRRTVEANLFRSGAI